MSSAAGRCMHAAMSLSRREDNWTRGQPCPWGWGECNRAQVYVGAGNGDIRVRRTVAFHMAEAVRILDEAVGLELSRRSERRQPSAIVLPSTPRRRLRTSSVLEGLNEEIERRTREATLLRIEKEWPNRMNCRKGLFALPRPYRRDDFGRAITRRASTFSGENPKSRQIRMAQNSLRCSSLCRTCRL